MVRRRGDKMTPEERAKRREEVFGFMTTLGPFSVPVKVLAEKYKVTVDSIYDDVEWWIKKIPLNKIESYGKKIIMSLKNNMAIAEELKAQGDPKIRLSAINSSNQTAEVLTKILESYGYKEVVSDRPELTFQNNFQQNISISQILTELKEEEKKVIDVKKE